MALTQRELALVIRNLPQKYIEAYNKGEISADDLEPFARKLGIGPDFSDVKTGSSVVEGDDGSLLHRSVANLAGERAADVVSSLGQKASAGFATSRAGAVQRGLDTDYIRSQEEAKPWYQRDVFDAVGLGPDERAAIDARIARVGLDGTPAEARDELLARARNNEASAKRTLDETGTGHFLLRTAQDVAGSPESALSVIGGPTAAIPAMTTYEREYLAGRQNGLSPAEADKRANVMKSIEFGISSIPAGKFIPGANKLAARLGGGMLASDAAKIATRVAKTAVGEGTEEAATSAAQWAADMGLATGDTSDTARKFSESNVPKSLGEALDQSIRNFSAGALGGTALSGPIESFHVMAERGKLTSDMLAAHEAAKAGRTASKEARSTPIDLNRETGDLFGGQQQQAPEVAQPAPVAEVTNREGLLKNRMEQLDRSIAEDEALRETMIQEQYKTSQMTEAGATVDPFDRTKLERIDARLAMAKNARRRLFGQTDTSTPMFGDTEQPANPTFRGDGTDVPRAVTPRDADKFYGPNGEVLSRTEQAAAQEATFEVNKAANAAKAKAEKSYKSARQAFLRRTTKEALGMDEDQRIPYVQEQLMQWDKNNTVDQYVTTTPQQRLKVKKDNAPSVAELRATAGGDATLAQESTTPKTSTTSDQIVQTLAKRMGGSDAKKIAKLMTDKNVEIVNDVSEVPGNAREGGAGFFDGNKTYIVANRINKENIMGELLNVAAHEVKHAADIGGTEKLKATIGEFIGTEANTQINRKIEALADSGNKVAIAARDAARKATGGDSTYALELPAYFINMSRIKREVQGPAARVAGNIVSAVRTAYKGMKGDADINLDDVAYLSDKLLTKAAEGGERLTGNINNPLPMIMDENAKGFTQAQKEGRTYISKDGVEKYVMSDADATLNEEALKNAKSDQLYTVKDFLNHPDLFEAMPGVADIPVSVRNIGGNNKFGSMTTYKAPGEKDFHVISLNTSVARGENENATARETLLHEIQHWVQAQNLERVKHVFERTVTPEQKQITDQYNAAKEIAEGKAEGLINNAYTISQTSPSAAENIRGVWSDFNLTPVQKADKIADLVTAHGTEDRDVAKQIADYNNARRNWQDLGPAAMRINKELYDDYASNITEAEAHFTGDTNNWRQEALPVNPETSGGFRSDNLNLGKGNALAFDLDAAKEAMSKLRNPDNYVLRGVKSAFGAFGNIGREIGNMKELADGFAAKYSHKAMNYFHEINRGLEIRAKRGVAEGKYSDLNTGIEQERKALTDQMQKIAEAPTEQDRISMMNSFARANPELAAFQKASQEIAMLSRTLVNQHLDNNPNPTPQERKLMATMLANTFRYTTNMYAAFQGEAGKQHSKLLLDHANSAKKLAAKGKDIPEKYKEAYRVYDNMVRYLSENDLKIPDEAGIAQLSNDRLTQLYATWVDGAVDRVKENARDVAKAEGMTSKEADQYVRNVMAEGLLARRDTVNSDQVNGKADLIIKGMLGVGDGGPISNYYRGFKQDRSILQEREQLPQEVKDLFGEITDPATRLAVTITKQAELAGRTRMLLDMRDKGIGKWVVPADQAGLPGNEKFTKQLTGEGFGPLEGYYTKPEIAAAIGDNLETFTTLSDALSKGLTNSNAPAMAVIRKGGGLLRNLAAKQKLLTVVADLYNLGTNAMGSGISLMANGITSPKAILGGAKVAAQVIWDTATNGSVELSPEFEDAVRYGILDSARVQEIRRTPQQFVKQLISDEGKAIKSVKSGFNRFKRTGVEMFAMSDAWTKIVAFQERANTLAKFYEAEGIQKSPHEIKSEAADQMKDTNITYSRVGAGIRAGESLGFTTFMPYFVSVPRAIAYNYAQGLKDIVRGVNATTPEGKQTMMTAGIKRVTGATAASMGAVYATKAIAAMVNGEDDEKVQKMKKLMYPDARFADQLYLGEDNKGVPLFARLSRIDPYGPLNDFMRIYADDDTSIEDKNRFAVQQLKDMLITNRVVVAGIKSAYDAVSDDPLKDTKTKLERMAPKTSEFFKDWAKKIPGVDYSDANSVLQFMDSFVPGIADMFDPRNTGAEDDAKDPSSRTISDLIRYSGGRVDRADPGLAAYGAQQRLKAARDQGKKRQADGLAAGDSTATLRNRYLDDARAEYEAARELSDVYDGMVNGLGYSPTRATAVLKEAKVDASDIGNIRNGKMSIEADQWINDMSKILSKDSQRKRAKSGGEEQTDEEKARLKEYLDEMKALGYGVKE